MISTVSREDDIGSIALRPRGSCAKGNPGSKATLSLLDDGRGRGRTVGQSQKRKSSPHTSFLSICLSDWNVKTSPSYQIYLSLGWLHYESVRQHCDHVTGALLHAALVLAGLSFLSSQEGQRTSCTRM